MRLNYELKGIKCVHYTLLKKILSFNWENNLNSLTKGKMLNQLNEISLNHKATDDFIHSINLKFSNAYLIHIYVIVHIMFTSVNKFFDIER